MFKMRFCEFFVISSSTYFAMPSQKQLLEIIGIQTEIAKRGLDLGGVMDLVVERTLDLIDADGAAIELAEDGDMVYRAVSGLARCHLGLRLKMASSLSGMAVGSRSILRCDDSEHDPRVDREACRKIGLRSMIVMPLTHDGNVVGVLKAMAVPVAKFSERDETLLGLLSEVVGAAMYHATRFDESDLYYRATHDALTELANRSAFMDRLRSLLAAPAPETRPAGILMIDMDGLKGINDNHGHRAGDAAIREVAQRIRSVSRDTDLVARLGGDEFGVILSPCEHSTGIDGLIRRLDASIRAPFSFEDTEHALGASIGGAHFPEDGDDIEHLLEQADRRMYAIKRENPLRRATDGRAHRASAQ